MLGTVSASSPVLLALLALSSGGGCRTGAGTNPTTAPSAPSASGALVGYWKLDEKSGTTVEDSSGRGNSGTFAGKKVSWITDAPDGSAVRFAGPKGAGWVALGNPDNLNFTGQITLVAWVRPENLTSPDIQEIIGHGVSYGPFGEVYLRVQKDRTGTTVYSVGSWDGIGRDHMTYAAVPPGDLGTWVHLAGSYDGASWRLYRNGTLISSTAESTGAVLVNSGWAIGASTGEPYYFSGDVAEVRIYNRGLGAAEIRDLYAQRRIP